MSDGNQYLIEKIDKLVDVVSENTVWVGRYMEKHDSVQKELTKLDLHVKTIGIKVQSHSETLAVHNGTHLDVVRVRGSIIFGVVTIILGLCTALGYVATMAKSGT
jgi:hypothetical protein